MGKLTEKALPLVPAKLTSDNNDPKKRALGEGPHPSENPSGKADPRMFNSG